MDTNPTDTHVELDSGTPAEPVRVSVRPFTERWTRFADLLASNYTTMARDNTRPDEAAAAALQMAAVILLPELKVTVERNA
jgi:hypothetical protein